MSIGVQPLVKRGSSIMMMFSRRRKQLVAHTSTTIQRSDFEEKWRKQSKAKQEEKLKDLEYEIQKLKTLLVSCNC